MPGEDVATADARRRLASALQHHAVQHLHHVASPLSAALLIFGVHKAWQFPLVRAYFKAQWILLRRGQAMSRAGSIPRTTRQAARFQRRAAHSKGGQTRAFSTTPALGRPLGIAPPATTMTRLPQHTSPAAATRGFVTTSTVSETAAALGTWWSRPVPHAQRTEGLRAIFVDGDVEAARHTLVEYCAAWRLEEAMSWMHATLGLPWWGVIAATTLAMRVALVPVNVKLLRNSMRMKVAMPDLLWRAQALARPGMSGQQAVAAARGLDAAFHRARAHPMFNMVVFPFVLPPTVLTLFSATHNLCLSEGGLKSGGLLWFVDLTQPDPSFVLPAVSVLSWLWLVEASAGYYYHHWTGLKDVSRAVALASIPVCANVPAGVLFFWVTSNAFAITRAYVLRMDGLRQWLEIPTVREVTAAMRRTPAKEPGVTRIRG